jgi:hypothetical protein
LRIALARIVRPQVDEAEIICRHPDRHIERVHRFASTSRARAKRV